MATTSSLETCENCGVTIGKLETPHLHNDHVICANCWEKLQPRAKSPPSPAPLAQADPPIERVEYQASPAMFGAHPLIFSVLILAALIGLFHSVIGTVFPLMILGAWRFFLQGEKLTVTTSKVIYHRGILLSRQNIIRRCDIRDLQVGQGFFQGFFNVGFIRVATRRIGRIN